MRLVLLSLLVAAGPGGPERAAAPAVGDEVRGRLERAEALFLAADVEGALAAYDAVIHAEPRGPLASFARYKRAWCLVNLDRSREAAEALEALVRDVPGTAIARESEKDLAWQLARVESPAGAARRLAAVAPDRWPELLARTAETLDDDGRSDDARAAFLLAAEGAPTVARKLRIVERYVARRR